MSNEIENRISDLVKDAMKDNLTPAGPNWPFLNIEDYTQKTGKRFRITMAQRDAGITREQAFQQFMEKLMAK
jgi:hypothetical protein